MMVNVKLEDGKATAVLTKTQRALLNRAFGLLNELAKADSFNEPETGEDAVLAVEDMVKRVAPNPPEPTKK